MAPTIYYGFGEGPFGWYPFGGGVEDVSRAGALIPYHRPGSYGISTELWRVRRNGMRIARIDPARVGRITITCNENIAVKRSATIETDDPTAFRALGDYLMPVLTISDPEGNAVSSPQGLFMVMPSPDSIGPAGTSGTIECRDLFQLFEMDSSPGYAIASGTDRGAQIRAWASRLDITGNQVQVPDFGVPQPDDRAWDAGTTLATCMTDMASGSNWYQPWFDLHGRLVTAPYKPLTDVQPSHLFTNATETAAADLEGQIQRVPDMARLANMVTVRKLGDSENPTIAYTARNMNPESPTSYQNIGKDPADWGSDGGIWVSKSVDNMDLVDEESARLQAEQMLSESASQYVRVTLPTFPLIDADVHQTVGLAIQRGDQTIYQGTWWRTGYTLTLDGSRTSMVQQLARVEAFR